MARFAWVFWYWGPAALGLWQAGLEEADPPKWEVVRMHHVSKLVSKCHGHTGSYRWLRVYTGGWGEKWYLPAPLLLELSIRISVPPGHAVK